MNFLQNLKLRKSQADALMNQLARQWEGEFDLLCARRQTVIVSVLESLRQHLFTFTLSSVIEEIGRWFESGRSCFARLAEKLCLTGRGFPADGRPSLLDRVIPVPSG